MVRQGMRADKFVWIPNGVDVAEWEGAAQSIPPGHAQAIERLRSDGAFVIGYAGGHSVSNSLDQLLDAAALLKDRPIRIVLVGDGKDKAALMERARSEGLDNVLFLDPVPKAAVPDLLRRFDACAIVWSRSPLYRFGIGANKIFDYMMAGKPILQALEAGNDPVEEYHAGITVPPEDVPALAAAAVRLSELPSEERLAMGENGRRAVRERHDYRVLARRFLDSLQS
jgi:glycosyltransferase involved in cell wall biosynthesis